MKENSGREQRAWRMGKRAGGGEQRAEVKRRTVKSKKKLMNVERRTSNIEYCILPIFIKR
jgi:hypothetical protein